MVLIFKVIVGGGFCGSVEALVEVVGLSFVSLSERFCRIIHSLEFSRL